MNTGTIQNYASYSTYMHKENISPAVNQPVFNINTVDEVDTNKKVESINESRRASNEELASLYFNAQANQHYNSVMQTLFDTPQQEESDTITHEVTRQLYIQKYKEVSENNQENLHTLERWA